VTAPNDITTVPSFVLRDYWIDGRISSEQYAAEVSRRNDSQSDLVEDNRRLREALTECQSALAMMIDPSCIAGSTLLNAFAAATSAEAKARSALSSGSQP
jgi:hypothetical protein